jgi:hypothetical protein
MRGENTKKQDIKSTDCDERVKVCYNNETNETNWMSGPILFFNERRMSETDPKGEKAYWCNT